MRKVFLFMALAISAYLCAETYEFRTGDVFQLSANNTLYMYSYPANDGVPGTLYTFNEIREDGKNSYFVVCNHAFKSYLKYYIEKNVTKFHCNNVLNVSTNVTLRKGSRVTNVLVVDSIENNYIRFKDIEVKEEQ